MVLRTREKEMKYGKNVEARLLKCCVETLCVVNKLHLRGK